ncbi:homeobox-leucine zipper protein HDG2-like isoform X1 [Nicotiana tomentosiformis]|uniref:homeobox-leucine zipper protein HDG2-like isoform X1 n=1 Tax=Nicotiana tomentosiformis TaxID=4098 RepID=UPI00051B945D|nr:homeobox-leucine zipper protein HDG2-like isoform X1 [Nicotiana tomentosiformis]XP_033514318.1 homeobox-leucine zipper protein HDG2-like isoform X1 [Nicotiana tomentosiformis]XP_033514320.1 homeobox-leucine zipper protein HDG2-like isoform X1 [Nicotiana tomentosiformis]
MPSRISRRANKMSSLVVNDGTDIGFSSSGLPLGQSSSMMDSQLHSLDMLSNTSESEMPRLSSEDFGSKSGNEGNSAGDEQDVNNKSLNKRKRYHRHTQHQIQELEAYFKECPHPDDKQRKELSRELGLEPLQIKFWFQNKRTQMKTKNERSENSQLRAENEKLRAENLRFREALGNVSCPNCGGQQPPIGEMSYDEHHLRLENTRLREEIERISTIASKYVGKPFSNHNNGYSPPLDLGVPAFSTPQSVNGDAYGDGEDVIMSSLIGPSDTEKPFIIELAVAAMEEFVQLAHMQEPLWFPSIENGTSLLNEEEYFRIFPRGIGPKPDGFKTEASRETAIVIMNHVNLVEILMDVNHWSSMFSGVVSRASTIDVLSTGVAGNFNGALQVILAEFQVPSPQVPTRECYFARYCKHRVDGTWAVVDVSLDHLRAIPSARCRRRPSGCLIQEMPNGYSKVTWVEHIEVDDSAVHNIYKPLVSSGLAFGAKRWTATLDRQCERLASAMATNFPTNDLGNIVLTNQDSRKSMLKLAERMVNSFCSGMSATAGNQWSTLSGSGSDDNVRVMTRKSVDDPGRPPGIVLSAATSFWLPISPKRVFDFLRDENTRSEWDILSNGGVVQEMAHIANGRETGNCVSLLRVNSSNSSQSNMLILQESSTDPTNSYVVYAPVDIGAMNIVLGGGDPDFVALLPSGFAILPDGPPGNSRVGCGGSLLTVAFQILVDSIPTAKLSLGSVATVNNLIACTVDRIKASLLSESTPS